MSSVPERPPARGSVLYDPKIRAVAYQILLIAVLGFLIYSAATNAIENLRAAKIASGFDFLGVTAGFDINQKLIYFDGAVSSYGRAFWVGLLNTLLVGSIGIVLATILGFLVGVARLSPNWIISKIAKWYVEVIRNLPLLLQLVFWYNAVLKPLPEPRNSVQITGLRFGTPDFMGIVSLIAAFGVSYALYVGAERIGRNDTERQIGKIIAALVAAVGAWFLLPNIGILRGTETGLFFLNNRGLYTPEPIFSGTAYILAIVLILGILASVLFRRWAAKQQAATGRQYPVGLITLGFIVALPVVTWLILSVVGTNPVTFAYATQGRFNLTGGLQIFPEFVALTFGLVIYTAAFIAEIVRAGIMAVSRGQTEAAGALGLRPGPTLRLVVIPQAMRVIVPPLTSQYLNLVKNSTLAVAIGYPDLVQIFAGTVLNQTGQAVEVLAVTMAVYLTISLVTSAIMNIYNRRVAIVER